MTHRQATLAPIASAESPPHVPAWSVFDRDWYVSKHPDLDEQMRRHDITDPSDFYQRIGVRAGHSPNMFFDEVWYLANNPDVARSVAGGLFPSGFAHYCHDGYRGRSPHWLFSERFYRANNPSITRELLRRNGFANGYDHYLTVGDSNFLSGHWFFDPVLYHDHKPEQDRSNPDVGGSFTQFLVGGCVAGTFAQISWYFDPAWYLLAYPDIADEIASGTFTCALHHYLANTSPRLYDPLKWFSETFYGTMYPDVQAASENGAFRNNYDHFVRFGAAESRQPHAELDLLQYWHNRQVQADLHAGLFRDPFAHWLCHHASGHHASGHHDEDGEGSRAAAAVADAMLPLFGSRPLDFSIPAGRGPSFSVVVVAQDAFAQTLRTLATLRGHHAEPIDVILVDAGSHDETRRIERYVDGLTVVRYGYRADLATCRNAALARVTAPAVLFLDAAALPGAGACERALERLRSDETIGAVGARCVGADGLLLEAGSIVWRDGTVTHYCHGSGAAVPEAVFVRDVDFCSTSFLMVRAEALQLGGFAKGYRTADFMAADLGLSLAEAGFGTVYDPSVVVQVLGRDPIAADRQAIESDRKLLLRRHLDRLRYHHPAQRHNEAQGILHARSLQAGSQHHSGRPGRPDGLRILLIEDRIPIRNIGSGYVRTNDIVHAMARLGHFVTVFPIVAALTPPIEIYRDFPDTVEILHDRSLETFEAFLLERARLYDVIWIGRIHNLERLLPIFNDAPALVARHGFVLDTEAVGSPRLAEQRRLLGRPAAADLTTALRAELHCAYFCQKIVAVNEKDAEFVRQSGHSHVSVLGHMKSPSPTPAPWTQRRGLLFLGAIHDDGSPNHDSLEWFMRFVLPRLDGHLPDDVLLTVAGFVRRGIDLSGLADHPRVDLIGPVDDLAALYGQHRVFVAPTRFAGGIPYKVHEAASYGVPVVASSLLCGQLGWQDNVEILDGGMDDPDAFAAQVIRCYADVEIWNTIRLNALQRLKAENDPDDYGERLQRILQDVRMTAEPEGRPADRQNGGGRS